MTDYIHLSVFKEHFFKWNRDYAVGVQFSSGTALQQLNRVMIRDMDKYIENSELKKLIKSM